MKTNKWHNYGDAHPMIHGGCYVRRDGDNIEVVQIDNQWEQLGKSDNYSKYVVAVASYSIDQLRKDFVDRRSYAMSIINGIEQGHLKEMTGDKLYYYLASERIRYFGGSTEGEYGNNFWELLGAQGITRSNIQI